MSYEEADEIADFLGRGLRLLGQAPGSSVCMFADTRAEWMLTAQACFKQSFPLVTLYTMYLTWSAMTNEPGEPR